MLQLTLYKYPLMVTAIVRLKIDILEDFEWAKSNKTSEYLAEFCLGKIPFLEGADGFLLTKSRTTSECITNTNTGLAKKVVYLGSDAKIRAKVWMSFASDHLADALQPLVG